MIIGNKGVKYGLEVRKPKQSEKSTQKKASVFGDDDSEDDHDNVEQQIARHAARKQADKKVRDLISYLQSLMISPSKIAQNAGCHNACCSNS